jgi:hypothetical protein
MFVKLTKGVLALLVFILMNSSALYAAPKFMTLPFADSEIKIVQGWTYTWGNPHKGIDYIKGEISEHQKYWQEFKVLVVADGEAMYVPGVSPSWGDYVKTSMLSKARPITR